MNIDEAIEMFPDTKKDNGKSLILYNDEVNHFDFVIESLIDVCDHTSEQASQCAYIAHFNGRCEVKSGSSSELKTMKDR